MFETLLSLLMRQDIDPATRIPIVDFLFGFAKDLDHLELVQKWLEEGAIIRENGEEVFKLGTQHKYSIVKLVYEEPSYPLELKQALLEKTIGDDNSDLAQNLRLTCRSLLPFEESKAQVWAEITSSSQ